MLIKTEKLVHIKKNPREFINVVREHYLRNDIPCKSDCCTSCTQPEGISRLPNQHEITHYVIPDPQCTRKYLEILQLKELTGIIFLQTVIQYVQQNGGKRIKKQLSDIYKNQLKRSIVFNNEFHEKCYVQRKTGQDIDDWYWRNIYSAAAWFHEHLEGKVSIIVLTENEKVLSKYGSETTGIFLMTMSDYIKGFWSSLDEAMDLLESLRSIDDLDSFNVGATICKDFQEYYPAKVLEAGIKSGRFIANYLRVNKYRPMHEAFLRKLDTTKSNDQNKSGDILIPGTGLRNRAIDGDFVAVEILPENQWQSKSTAIQQLDGSSSLTNTSGDKMITGRVVGVLQRSARDYVVSIPEEEVESRSSKILTVPWDRRIPKVRISTRQKDRLKTERFVVRIDAWDVTSLYPKGHFVRSLGPCGNIETEISCILIEHGLSVGAFSEGIMKEMPVNNAANEWKMSQEIKRRKDLRKSHLIFSIDPKGCEDVDDTLSVRKLENGNWELGVHIADVTYFVKPNSLTDLEARSKTTTIYLADRRYDMLPAALSSDLCSLISEQDRYAVSVIWELDNKCDVIDVWYGRTIIRSKYKLFYEAAQEISTQDMSFKEAVEAIPELKNIEDAKQRKQSFEEMREAIKNLMYIARMLKSKRAENGAIDLESTEVRLEMNENKDIKEMTPKQSLEVHETIAECMIFANHWVAKRIKDKYPSNSILRCHPPPNQDFFSTLKDCAKSKGFQIDTSTNHTLAVSLDACVDEDASVNKIFRILGTQAMMVASYFSTGSLSAEQFSHYGLALDCYTHFTSPIRRYADVLVHRLLLASIGDALVCEKDLLVNKDLQELCEHINTKHRDADHAQKESLELFQAMYFRDHSLDDSVCVVDAMIYNFRSNGVLVYIPKFGIKGAVSLRDREGNVACSCGDNIVYKPGSLRVESSEIVIKSTDGPTVTLCLFSYIKVRINVVISTMHPDRLSFQLISLTSSVKNRKKDTSGKDSLVNVSKTDLIQQVKTAETEMLFEKERLESRINPLKESMITQYGQTHQSVSLYEMFRNFKMDALALPKKKTKKKKKTT